VVVVGGGRKKGRGKLEEGENVNMRNRRDLKISAMSAAPTPPHLNQYYTMKNG
jgi:hypothetical protein